jgi:hypothetical protein
MGMQPLSALPVLVTVGVSAGTLMASGYLLVSM